jgi:hypothetical protein
LNHNYQDVSNKHHLKNAIELNREVEISPKCDLNIVTSLTSIEALSPDLGAVSEGSSHPLKNQDVGTKLKRQLTRKLNNRRKRPPTDGWRLNDKEFNELHNRYSFTLEACCDPSGLNGHRNLPYYSEQNSLLDHDVSGQSIYCNPPWSLAIKCVEHLRSCHSKSPLDTKAVIVLPDWPKFKAVTKELKLIKQLPKGEMVFMRTTPSGNYDPPDLIASTWVINFWLIDANTPVLSPMTSTNIRALKPNVITTQLESNATIEAANKYLSTTATIVIMDPYKAEALMRFTADVSLNNLSAKADTLIDTAASLNFVSKEFLLTNGFYKSCKTAPKLAIRVASEQRISTTKVFVLLFSLLMDMTSPICSLEFYLTLKVQTLSWDCQL